jgi:hypothetical protein
MGRDISQDSQPQSGPFAASHQDRAVLHAFAGRQAEPQAHHLPADEVGAFEADRPAEHAGVAQRGDAFRDAYPARPPRGLDRGDALLDDPPRVGAVPQGREGEPAQHDLQRRVAEADPGDVVERPVFLRTLSRLEGVEHQVGECRAEVGPVGLRDRLRTAAAKHEVLAAKEVRPLVQLDERRIHLGSRGREERGERQGESSERLHGVRPGLEQRLSRRAPDGQRDGGATISSSVHILSGCVISAQRTGAGQSGSDRIRKPQAQSAPDCKNPGDRPLSGDGSFSLNSCPLIRELADHVQASRRAWESVRDRRLPARTTIRPGDQLEQGILSGCEFLPYATMRVREMESPALKVPLWP